MLKPKEGIMIKKEKSTITFKCTKEFKEKTKEYCLKTDNKMSRLIRVAVDEYMKNHPKEN